VVTPLPPMTTERIPAAMLLSPPLTLAKGPLAILSEPPLMLATLPLAVFAADAGLKVFDCVPLTRDEAAGSRVSEPVEAPDHQVVCPPRAPGLDPPRGNSS
jgi:hypothetical protein